MRKKVAVLVLAGIFVLGVAVPASASDLGGRPDAPATRRAVQRVSIVNFAFRPRRVEIPRGTRVRWTNTGSVAHTTTSTTGIWDSGSLATGDTFSRVFRARGTFRYLCTIHTDMTGKIVVT